MLRWSAHIDWITTTWPADAGIQLGTAVEALWSWYCQLDKGVTGGGPLQRWAWQGYVGWQMGSLCIGERLDSTIVRVSGALAHMYWQANKPTGHNVSRLDICIDIWHAKMPDEMIALHNGEALQYRSGIEGRPYAIAHVNGYGGGDTLYLGSRSSETFGRIYNKEQESNGKPEYEGCTRYEVEYKGETARQVVSRVGGRRNDSRCIAAEVQSVLIRRGIDLSDYVGQVGPSRPPAARIATPDDRKLAWLRDQVSPTVKHLLTVYDRQTILSALGLNDVP